MRHVPFFRRVLILGVALIGCSLGVYLAVPDLPELRQVELTVLDEKSDGTCRVRWTDPFEFRDREDTYQCDAGRDPILKAPNHDMGSGFGWESGFVVAEGGDTGELYSLDAYDAVAEERIGRSDGLVVGGLVLTVVGLVGGGIRRLSRVGGASPGTVRRARRLREAAALVVRDHERAVEAVRQAWAPLHRELVDRELGRIPVARLENGAGGWLRAKELERGGVRTVREVLDAGALGLERSGVGRRTADKVVTAARRLADELDGEAAVRVDAGRPEPRTTALLVALWVLAEAGPRAGRAAEAGRELAVRLEQLLIAADPAAGYRRMLGAGPEQRRRAPAAVAELRRLLERAEREGTAQEFAQASVDLLRQPDSDPAGLQAWVDFESRPARYYSLLADVTGRSLPEPNSSGGARPVG